MLSRIFLKGNFSFLEGRVWLLIFGGAYVWNFTMICSESFCLFPITE